MMCFIYHCPTLVRCQIFVYLTGTCVKKLSPNNIWKAAEQRYLCDAKDNVYGCGQWVDRANQFTAHNLRKDQRHWLAQHHRF